MDFATAVEGASQVSLCMLHLGSSLADQENHRYSALVYASMSRSPGATEQLQAFSLFKAAQQLFLSVKKTKDNAILQEDRTRSLSYLQKASVLLQGNHQSFDLIMHVFSLMESICSFFDDHINAAKAIDSALEIISVSVHDSTAQLRWFSYFRSHAISNALACGKSIEYAANLAHKTAEQCESHGDFLPAVAFYLTQTQIALAGFVTGYPTLDTDLASAANCLSRVDRQHDLETADLVFVRFVFDVMQCFSYLRSANMRDLNELALPDLTQSYSKLRQVQKQKVPISWQWLPQPFLSALAFYIATFASRGGSNSEMSIVHSMTALARVGITEDRITSLTLNNIYQPNVSQRGNISLIVALLENAVRIRLTEMNLEPAAALIAVTVDLAFPNEASRATIRRAECGVRMQPNELLNVLSSGAHVTGLVPCTTAFVLISEYHNLRGLVSSAEISTEFLMAVKSIANHIPHGQLIEIPDNWHMAVSRLSILTGTRRLDIAQEGKNDSVVSEEEDEYFCEPFISKPVLAYAWFTIGVHHIRATEVLEARHAIQRCITLANSVPHGHDQLIANASVVLSGLILTHREINADAGTMLDGAMDLARKLKDDVTIFRTLRQRRKLIHRISESREQVLQIDEEYAQQNQRLVSQRRATGHIFASDNQITIH